MITFLFHCPATKLRVQGRSDDDKPSDDMETFIEQLCPACRRVHLVNPKTGKVLGSD